MKIDLNRAEIGLLFTLLLDDLLEDQQGQSYEVIVTGETADTPQMLKKFADLVMGVPDAKGPEQAGQVK